jgi:type II secretory pathway pseudopilin PulG
MWLRQHYRSNSREYDPGYAMAGLLVAIAIMGVLMSVIMPTWRNWAKREKEAEMVFRGGQYSRAIELYQRRNGPGTYPADIEALVDGRFLRQAFPDPMVEDGIWEMVTLGMLNIPVRRNPGMENQDGGNDFQNEGRNTSISAQARRLNSGEGNDAGPVMGVRSRSTESSLLVLNGRNRYDEWLFTYPATGQTNGGPVLGSGPGGVGQNPGQPGVGQNGRGGGGDDVGLSQGFDDQRHGIGGSRSGGPGFGVGQLGDAQSLPRR